MIDTILEFTISVFENGKNVIDIRPRVMLAFMPALRALLKRFVVALSTNQSCQKDIFNIPP